VAQERWFPEPTTSAQASQLMKELKTIPVDDTRDQQSNLLQAPHAKPHVLAKRVALHSMDPEATAVLRELQYLYKTHQMVPAALGARYTASNHDLKSPRNPPDPQEAIRRPATLPLWVFAVTLPLSPPLTEFESVRLYEVRRRMLGRLSTSILTSGERGQSPFLSHARPAKTVLSQRVAKFMTLK